METLTLESDELRVELNPDRGAEITFAGRPGGRNLLAWYEWQSPLPAERSRSYGRDELDWLSSYRGGWQELFPSGGSACEVAGVPLPFHGEVSTARWELTELGRTQMTLQCAARLPLVLERTLRLGDERPALFVEERVRNDSNVATRFTWGHHPAFAALPGTAIDLPGGTPITASEDYQTPLVDVDAGSEGTWPHLPGRDDGEVDLSVVPAGRVQRVVYAHDLTAGWAAVRSPASGDGAALAWDLAMFPHLWLWFELGGPDFPWFGRTSIVALEPQSFWPADGLAAAIERGQAHHLGAGDSTSSWITFVALDSAHPVGAISREGEVVLARTPEADPTEKSRARQANARPGRRTQL